MNRLLKPGVSAWNRFWFESHSPEKMRFFRVCFASLIFLFYCIRALDLEFLFGDSGISPVGSLRGNFQVAYRFSLLDYFTSREALWSLHILFQASLLSLVFGFFPRLSAAVALILHNSFINRNLSIVQGVDLISSFFLLYLILADYRLRRAHPDFRAILGSVAFRLCQLQICIIYGYSGFEKLRGFYWWKGEAIWNVLANAQLARFDNSWAAHVPLLLLLMTYVTVLWETYFPVLIWNDKLRSSMLGIGVVLHLGIGVLINIPFFSALMVLSYSLFLEPRHLAWIKTVLVKKMVNPIQVRLKPADENIV